jgi:hypothetical protein
VHDLVRGVYTARAVGDATALSSLLDPAVEAGRLEPPRRLLLVGERIGPPSLRVGCRCADCGRRVERNSGRPRAGGVIRP